MGLRSRSTLLTVAIGLLTGHLYRSELADLKNYRLPPAVVRFSKTYLLPAVGSLRAPNRTLIALPIQNTSTALSTTPSAAPDGTTPIDEQPITTAPSSSGDVPSGNGPSVMRQWVDELTGRAQNAEAGLHVPSEAEITHVTSMFPELDREVIIAALQRRCVTRLLLVSGSNTDVKSVPTSSLLLKHCSVPRYDDSFADTSVEDTG
jgi:hypothetical protein